MSKNSPSLFRAAALIVAISALSACLPTADAPVTNPDRYGPTDAPIPFAVLRLVPRGVTEPDIRVWENCYAYAFNGTIYPVLNPTGSQYCI